MCNIESMSEAWQLLTTEYMSYDLHMKYIMYIYIYKVGKKSYGMFETSMYYIYI